MAKSSKRTQFDAVIVDETVTYSLRQVCESCGIYAEQVIEMIEYGIVEPSGESAEQWLFDVEALFRVRRALNLCHDLGLNLSGASLALDLLDELQALRLEVERLSRWSE